MPFSIVFSFTFLFTFLFTFFSLKLYGAKEEFEVSELSFIVFPFLPLSLFADLLPLLISFLLKFNSFNLGDSFPFDLDFSFSFVLFLFLLVSLKVLILTEGFKAVKEDL